MYPEKYPQKVYDFLMEADFREYLRLCYESTDGALGAFYDEVVAVLGKNIINYVDLLFIVASKDLYHIVEDRGQLFLFNSKQTEKYPQKLFNFLASREFRTDLVMCYFFLSDKSIKNFYIEIKKEIDKMDGFRELENDLEDKIFDIMDLLYAVASKE